MGAVTECMAKVPDASTYTDFAQRPTSQGLRNPDLIDKHYSDRVLASDRARTEFVPPDLKKIASTI